MLTPLGDTLARPLRDLRISVIDRCNFRCTYCMPKQAPYDIGEFLSRQERLSDAEIARLVQVFVSLGVGEIGLINSITEPFCDHCSRARVTADGMFYTCLFSGQGINLRPLLTGACDPQALARRIHTSWSERQSSYSQNRGGSSGTDFKVEMHRLGG